MMLEIEGDGARYVRHHGQLLRVESPLEGDEEARWKVIVMKTVATEGSGVEALRQRIDAHRRWLLESGEMALREQLRIAHTLENILRAELNRRIASRIRPGNLEELVERIRRREIDPYSAAADLLAHL
jgi:LAO/AO transport system kinase